MSQRSSRICEYCDEIFIPVSWQQVYCGAYCRQEMSHFKREAREWEEGREETSRKMWERSIRIKFGISPETYIEMLDKQNSRCAICGRHQEELPKRMAVDHNHDTGKVRGLLCGNCNTGIGNLRDSIDMLRKAIDYLEKHE